MKEEGSVLDGERMPRNLERQIAADDALGAEMNVVANDCGVEKRRCGAQVEA